MKCSNYELLPTSSINGIQDIMDKMNKINKKVNCEKDIIESFSKVCNRRVCIKNIFLFIILFCILFCILVCTLII